jgi:hypothetical protein
LVAQDESTLTNRLNTLEKKIQLQADEIVCLKSALADAIRRLQSVEHHQTNTHCKNCNFLYKKSLNFIDLKFTSLKLIIKTAISL